MKITIHRGLEQIGGCITEISTATSRVFIDMGQNLPGTGEKTTPEQDRAMVEGIFSKNKKDYETVVYSHAHEDHIGLFDYVPEGVQQYIGEGALEMLIVKYNLIKEGHEIGQSDVIEDDKRKVRKLHAFRTWERTKPRMKPKCFEIGDIRITPFFNCHSIYDSYMFLIEDGKERIWHTGDFRGHGYLGKGLFPTLKRYATDIDVLITEGTMLGRTDECIHEGEVSRKMAAVMAAFKYVVVLASATDIERLASIKEAAKTARKDLYICSKFMKQTMQLFTRREGKVSDGLFEFNPKMMGLHANMAAMRKKGFVLIAGVSKQDYVEMICKNFDSSDILFIYSSWDGYYKDPKQVEVDSRYKRFREAFSNVVDIHTSGHADRATIHKVIDIVNPRKVICIHKDADSKL